MEKVENVKIRNIKRELDILFGIISLATLFVVISIYQIEIPSVLRGGTASTVSVAIVFLIFALFSCAFGLYLYIHFDNKRRNRDAQISE